MRVGARPVVKLTHGCIAIAQTIPTNSRRGEDFKIYVFFFSKNKITMIEKKKWIMNLNRFRRMIVIAVCAVLRIRRRWHTIITINLIFCGFPLFPPPLSNFISRKKYKYTQDGRRIYKKDMH